MECRNCHKETGGEVLVDLGMQPLANSLWNGKDVMEPRYPLAPVICKNWHCRLIQLPELSPGIEPFGSDYPYRSGQSEEWKNHLRRLLVRAGVHAGDHVLDVGGNDGTLGRLTPLGVEYVSVDPSSTWPDISAPMTRRFGEMVGEWADHIFALNVAAHVPDLDDFFAGIHAALKPTGQLVVEVQDVNRLIERGEWDCIYHEHYSYFNKQTLFDALERRGFFVLHSEELSTHGGSIRAYARKHDIDTVPLRIMKPYPKWPPTDGLSTQAGMCLQWANEGRRVVGYGAPAKAMTWLNSYGVKLAYIVDGTPEKQGKYTPGSHIEISSPRRLEAQCRLGKTPPDIVVILAWNWKDEILPKIPAGPEVWCRGERLR